MGGGGDKIQHVSILDAFSSVHRRVNLVGVALEFSVPKRSKGTDYFCSVRIVDRSHDTRGLSVLFFARSLELLPRVGTHGDIVIVYNVEIKVHSKEIFAQFNKKYSSFGLFEGRYGKSFTPYQIYSKFRVNGMDKSLISSLRKWLDDFPLDTTSRQSVQLKGIKLTDCFDLVCKIIHVCEVDKDERMLFVWDGTDAPLLPIETKLGNENEALAPLQLEDVPLPRDTLCTFPTVGTILPVRVDPEYVDLSTCTGGWVKFINMSFQVYKGRWYGFCKPFTRIHLVPNQDRHVQKLQSDYEERLSSKFDRMPSSSFPWPSPITDTEKTDVAFVTLFDIIAYSKVTAKFKCVARVVDAFPWNVEDFLSPSGVYRLRLTLEDPTGRLHAYVYSEDGEMFFNGYPLIHEMRRKQNMLLGIQENDNGDELEDAPRSPPWIELCIKSYYVDKSNPWRSRRYRIFGTRLNC
ncbi:hypothetical protein Drorol1_Dr00010913 [Drosera rotundifolia]